jgi:hypothetical protein
MLEQKAKNNQWGLHEWRWLTPCFNTVIHLVFLLINAMDISPVLFLLGTILAPRVRNFRGSNYKFSLGWGISCIRVTKLSYSDVVTWKNSITAVTASFVIPFYSFAVTQPFDAPHPVHFTQRHPSGRDVNAFCLGAQRRIVFSTCTVDALIRTGTSQQLRSQWSIDNDASSDRKLLSCSCY